MRNPEAPRPLYLAMADTPTLKDYHCIHQKEGKGDFVRQIELQAHQRDTHYGAMWEKIVHVGMNQTIGNCVQNETGSKGEQRGPTIRTLRINELEVSL